jgi:hypothetical protein
MYMERFFATRWGNWFKTEGNRPPWDRVGRNALVRVKVGDDCDEREMRKSENIVSQPLKNCEIFVDQGLKIG